MSLRFLLLTALSLLLHVSLFSQDTSELVKRNGFKDIKLGSLVDSVKGIVFKKDITERKEFAAKLYETEDDEYKKIGDVSVKEVAIKAYKGLIYEIVVTTVRDPKIMKGLERSYGKPTYSIRAESYYWKSDVLGLIYRGSSKEIVLTYRGYPVYKMMYADKDKKIDEVAEDF